jgi:hypothetical protein
MISERIFRLCSVFFSLRNQTYKNLKRRKILDKKPNHCSYKYRYTEKVNEQTNTQQIQCFAQKFISVKLDLDPDEVHG